VRISERLTDSPTVLVLGEHDVPERMRRILAAAGQKTPQGRPVLEVNVGHPAGQLPGRRHRFRAVRRARATVDEQAVLAEGGQLANAPEYVQRLNRLLVRLAAPPRVAS